MPDTSQFLTGSKLGSVLHCKDPGRKVTETVIKMMALAISTHPSGLWDLGSSWVWGQWLSPNTRPSVHGLSLTFLSGPRVWQLGVVNARLLCPWNSPRKNTGMGCHSLLQGTFLAQGLNPGLLHYCLSHQGNPISSQVLTYQSGKGKGSCGFTITTVHSPLAQSS